MPASTRLVSYENTVIYVPRYSGLLHCSLHLASIPAGHRYQGAVEPNDQNHPMVRAKEPFTMSMTHCL
jgi:hypothetical protein